MSITAFFFLSIQVKFKDFYKIGTNHRHRRGFTDHDKHYRRKHLNLVPDYVKTDPTKNEKIEKLKNRPGFEICSPNDVIYITKNFNIVPHRDKINKLGSTGIIFAYNKKLKRFTLQKK